MKNNIFYTGAASILVIGAIVAYYFYGSLTARPGFLESKVVRGNIQATLNLNGKIRPENSANLGFEIGGKIIQLTHNVGDFVSAGTPLAFSNAADLQATQRQAQNLYSSAKANLDYYEQLLKKEKEELNSLKEKNASSEEKDVQRKQIKASESQVDSQKANVLAAENSVQISEAQLEKTIITAPFDGIISKQDSKVGETVQSDIPIIILISQKTFKVEVFVSELEVKNLQIGDEAKINLDDDLGQVYGAKITAIDPAETNEENVANYKVTLKFNENISSLRSGAGANISIKVSEKNDVVLIAQKAIFEKNGKKFVYVSESGLRVEKEIQTGIYGANGQAEITSGLNTGDIIFVTNK